MSSTTLSKTAEKTQQTMTGAMSGTATEGQPFVFTGRGSMSPERLLEAARNVRMPRVPEALRRRLRSSLRDVAERAAAKAATKAANGGARGLGERIVDRATMGWTLFEQEQVEEMGLEAYLDRQLDPASIDDGGLDQALEEAFPSLTASPAERFLIYGEDGGEVIAIELFLASLIRQLYSPRQLLERMVVFWSDHFNISLFSDFGPILKPTDDREVIRRHALGKFPDLLRASAHSPAMLSYLTNDSNVVGHPNENYARELMELHSMGVDGGFTEADVKEVARALTGWLYYPRQAGLDFGRFLFYPPLHDDGPKTILGQDFPAGQGIGDGEQVIDLLAEHPSTARFVSRKLLRYFWGYEPEDRSVEKIAAIYRQTGGDIAAMLRGIFRWWRISSATPKVKRPQHLVIASLRALFAQIEEPLFLIVVLFGAGHLPFTWGPPNGFPDSEGYWSGFVLPRLNYAATLLRAEPPVVTLDLPFLDPALSPEELVTILDFLLLDLTMSETTRSALVQFLDGPRDLARLADAIGLVIACPEFQRY